MAERKVMTEIWESLGHVTFHRPQGKRGQSELSGICDGRRTLMLDAADVAVQWESEEDRIGRRLCSHVRDRWE